jgi:hypothetical protein
MAWAMASAIQLESMSETVSVMELGTQLASKLGTASATV